MTAKSNLFPLSFSFLNSALLAHIISAFSFGLIDFVNFVILSMNRFNCEKKTE